MQDLEDTALNLPPADAIHPVPDLPPPPPASLKPVRPVLHEIKHELTRIAFEHADTRDAEQEPFSFARGMAFAIALSLPIWAGIGAAVWAMLR